MSTFLANKICLKQIVLTISHITLVNKVFKLPSLKVVIFCPVDYSVGPGQMASSEAS